MGGLLPVIASYYRPYYVVAVIKVLKSAGYEIGAYVPKYLKTETFEPHAQSNIHLTAVDRLSVIILCLFGLVYVAICGNMIAMTFSGELPEGWIFGTALLVLLPVCIAFFAPLASLFSRALMFLSPKYVGRSILCRLLENDVKKLRASNDFKTVAIAGSVGKTSTKLAIAQTLTAAGLRVRYQEGNYNDRVTVPLVFFNHTMPSLYNISKWLSILAANKRLLKKDYPFDVVVVELGSDGPGQLEAFEYIKPDLAVVTAIAPEHMEYFGTLDAVAEEELTITKFSKKVLINTDDTAEQYIKGIEFIPYGLSESGNGYTAELLQSDTSGQRIVLFKNDQKLGESTIAFLGPQGRKIILAAAAVADTLGVALEKVATAIQDARPFSGRLQQLEGIKNTTLLDDTYNANPSAVEAALQVLNDLDAPQRIAVLGSMNELGDFGPEAHKTIGASIDPSKIDLVVTIGTLARDYLAPAAVGAGCRVISLLNPHEAGKLVKSEVMSGAVILFKGSQNGVFAEEAIKPMLKHQKDISLLVRQSDYWMRIKRKQFQLPK